jgi:sec-independent protein translocase protein TatA
MTKGFLMRLFEGWHLVVLALVVVALFGYKRMPDAARSLGRSMRIFKSEIDEMKKDEPTKPSAASSDTVKGETVRPAADPIQDPPMKAAGDPSEGEKHNQPPA